MPFVVCINLYLSDNSYENMILGFSFLHSEITDKALESPKLLLPENLSGHLKKHKLIKLNNTIKIKTSLTNFDVFIELKNRYFHVSTSFFFLFI